jgi:hypothetical protein
MLDLNPNNSDIYLKWVLGVHDLLSRNQTQIGLLIKLNFMLELLFGILKHFLKQDKSLKNKYNFKYVQGLFLP